MLGGSLFFVGRSLSEDREREVKGSSSEELGESLFRFCGLARGLLALRGGQSPPHPMRELPVSCTSCR